MQITNNTIVAIDYVLKDDDGQVIDTSEGADPLSYLHGAGRIIPGLEQVLDGKQVGDEFEVAIAPKDAYGERNEALRQEVPRQQFDDFEDLTPGMQFRLDSNPDPLVVTVVEIAEETVTIDGNHPLAGVNLNFEVKIRAVREATEEELAHGHSHGPGGNSH